ncbi:MAG: hypothetical protein DWI22_13615 [Planctomycetota bacterium]|nr:MAG: hypothetical protein DWI22_13615 [Planctomycetota bacterium]
MIMRESEDRVATCKTLDCELSAIQVQASATFGGGPSNTATVRVTVRPTIEMPMRTRIAQADTA